MNVAIRRWAVRWVWLIAVLSLFATQSLAAATSDEARIGRKIENFTLDDFRGAERSLDDLSDAKLVVVAFMGTECPLANLYTPKLAEIAKEYESKGVAFVGINSNQQDSITEVASHATRHKLPFNVLKDPGNEVADRFGAVRTPEVFVLDGDRVVRYWGRVDDHFGIGYQKQEATREDLKVALDELLAGKSVSVAKTDAPGCFIGRVQRPDPSGDVTYSNQIARILKDRCVECHHEGQIAPFTLTEYDDVVGWAEMIREVVHERRMPPWLAAEHHDEFQNNPSMSQEEIALIDEWVDNGCPEGDPANLPEPAAYAKGWGISKPDEVFYMSDEPYTIPGDGVVEYQYYTVDPGWKEDKWIQQAEVKAGNAAVTHHVIVFVQGPGEGRFGAPQMAFAPGMTPRRFEPGMAMRARAGSKLVFQCHYTPNGTEQQDRSYVGFVYADPKDVTHEILGGACGQMALNIPPNDPNHKVEAGKLFLKDSYLLGMNPHMHLRGKSFRYELELPDGTRELLLDVPRYDFNWQLWYLFDEPKLVPKGSRMVCTAYFDNSADNPANPDPSQTVNWGEQTWDEMMFGFYSTVKERTDLDDKGD
ncbi:MAG: thiol-disulfide isomerase [Planctomycetota bacterium]|nr:MAG: thiol-disulfide isomerase [Planctomycetota bacterium]